MRRSKCSFVEFLYLIGLVLCVIIIIGFLGLEVFLWIRYGNKPITEIPAWAYSLMFNKE